MRISARFLQHQSVTLIALRNGANEGVRELPGRLVVILSEAKYLINLDDTNAFEILRLTPQNDIVTQSGK